MKEQVVDRFGNELSVGDFVVFAVGQGQARGGQRFGRVTRLDSPVMTSIEEQWEHEWDNPDEKAYDYGGKEDSDGPYLDKPTDGKNHWQRERRGFHYKPVGYKEKKGRKIASFPQVVKIDIETTLQNNKQLLEFCKSL